jgi:hypothetical protein
VCCLRLLHVLLHLGCLCVAGARVTLAGPACAMSGWQLIPLRWMRPSAEQPQSIESTADCTFSKESSRTCTPEIRDGVAYERCKSYFSLMRNCPGRWVLAALPPWLPGYHALRDVSGLLRR